MADVNQVCLSGRCTKDAIMKRAGGYDLCSFTVACNGFKPEDTMFVQCNLWGKRAEGLYKYLTKGKRVCVSGSLRKNEYENMNGVAVKEFSVNVNEVVLLDDPKTDTSSKEQPDIPPNDGDDTTVW